MLGVSCLITATSASAECEGKAIGRELTLGGWTFEARGKYPDSDTVFRIVKDGAFEILYADPDGDLMFRSYLTKIIGCQKQTR